MIRLVERGEGHLEWEPPYHLLRAGFLDVVLVIDGNFAADVDQDPALGSEAEPADGEGGAVGEVEASEDQSPLGGPQLAQPSAQSSHLRLSFDLRLGEAGNVVSGSCDLSSKSRAPCGRVTCRLLHRG